MSPASAILSKNFFDFFAEKFARIEISIYICTPKGEGNAEIAQLVEHNLAKVGVASSSLVFRSRKKDGRRSSFFCVFATVRFARATPNLPLSGGRGGCQQMFAGNTRAQRGSSLVFRTRKKDGQKVILFSCVCGRYCSYSCQLLICSSDKPFSQKASMKADARRAFVMSGVLWSMAARRMR